jgi:hypothetical protein
MAVNNIWEVDLIVTLHSQRLRCHCGFVFKTYANRRTIYVPQNSAGGVLFDSHRKGLPKAGGVRELGKPRQTLAPKHIKMNDNTLN